MAELEAALLAATQGRAAQDEANPTFKKNATVIKDVYSMVTNEIDGLLQHQKAAIEQREHEARTR